MNEPTSPRDDGHPTTASEDELVSAVLDGEATEAERATVDADPRLRARRDEFSRIRDAAAVQAPDRSVTDTTIARVLAETTDARSPATATGVVDLERARRRRRLATALGAAAALVIVVPLLAIALASGDRDADLASTAESTTEDATADDAASLDASPSSTTRAGEQTEKTVPLDFGSVASIDQLRIQVEAAVAARQVLGSEPGEAGRSLYLSPNAEAPAASESGTALRLAGSCAGTIRAADPALDALELIGTSTLDGEPVIVLVFGRSDAVLVVARLDCTTIDRSNL